MARILLAALRAAGVWGGIVPPPQLGTGTRKGVRSLPTLVHSPPGLTGRAWAQVQVGQRGVRVGGSAGGAQGVGPDLGLEVGRASAVWAGALGLQIFGLSSWTPQDPLPVPSSMILGDHLPTPPGSRGHWQWTRRTPPGPAGSQLRGSDHRKARLTVGPTGVEWPLAGGERLTVTRAMRPGRGHLGWSGHSALSQLYGQSLPRRTRKERPEPPGPGTSSGAALKGPDTRPTRPAEPARRGRRPSLRVSSVQPPRPRPRTRWRRARGGAQVRSAARREVSRGPATCRLRSGVRSLLPGGAPAPALSAPPT